MEGDHEAMAAARRTMVDCQVRPSDVTRTDLIDAMLRTPREAFFPKSRRAVAYVGEHVQVADGRFELDPRVFAKLVDAAGPQPSDLALVIGGGYGYMAAILSQLCAAVVTLEPNVGMRGAAEEALSAFGADNVLATSGPLADGYATQGPYNVILVNGAVAEAPPSAWTDQLAEGGRLATIRLDGDVGRCQIYTKSGDAVGARWAFDAGAPLLPGFEPEAAFSL